MADTPPPPKSLLGEPEFFSTSQIAAYCNNARLVLRPLYAELHIAAEELEAALRYVRSANPSAMGVDSRLRAHLVAGHLRRAAEGVEMTIGSIVRTHGSFRRHFVAELEQSGYRARPRREFKFDE